MMRFVLAELEAARRSGYSATEIARHLWDASAGALANARGERYRLADVLRAWADELEREANALPVAMGDTLGHA